MLLSPGTPMLPPMIMELAWLLRLAAWCGARGDRGFAGAINVAAPPDILNAAPLKRGTGNDLLGRPAPGTAAAARTPRGMGPGAETRGRRPSNVRFAGSDACRES